MSSFYRRHRPQSFSDVVGQEPIVRTLGNAIEHDKVHHAYLFVGSRGTGKTSIAKILARSLDCVNGPTLTPCGVCESCMAIAAGSSLDVIEMDAASNNSVDDIRDLREKVGFAPALGRWKVYILDEAHMLSTAAWNAFLKTLEEPPAHAIFVLATTEAHKVPATIVDRCHRFDFRRPSLEELLIVLRRVCDAEEIDADDRALAMIARSASGSFRDALGTLDQLVTYGGSKLSLENVMELLDVSDAELIFAATAAIATRDPRAALQCVAELAESGSDPAAFIGDLIDHLRQIVVTQTLGEVPETFSVTADQTERLATQAGTLSQAETINAIDLVASAGAATKEGSNARIQLELALLKAANPAVDASMEALFARLERLEGGERISPAPPVPQPKKQRKQAEQPPPEPVPEIAPDPERSDVQATDVAVEDVSVLWPAVIDRLRESEGGEMLAAMLSEARPAALEGDVLVLAYPHSASFSKKKVEDSTNGRRITDMLGLVAGRPLRIRVELTDDDTGAAQETLKLDEDEVIRRVVDAFDAEEVTVGSKDAPDNHDETSDEPSEG